MNIDLVLLAILVLGTPGVTAAQRPVEPRDLLRLREVRDPQLSPDGEWVAYTVTAADTVRDRQDRDVWMTGWDHSNLGDLMALGARRVETLVFAHPKYSGDMLYGASDNRSLVEKGVIAHSFSAGSLHEDYHQPTDDWQKLELDHMTAVIRGLFAGALPLADGDLTPAKSVSESAR